MQSKVILALDVTEKKKAVNLANLLCEDVYAIKVNLPIVMENGIEIVKTLSKYSNIICDFKLADVPHMVSMITRKALENGAYGIISHSFPGYDSLSEIVKVSPDMKVFSVVSMSNEGSMQFIDKSMEDLIDISIKAGVYGYVAPGNRYEVLKKIRSKVGKSIIISPGIGAQGGDAQLAVKNGADYVIVGRSIYESADPLGSLNVLNASLS